MFARRLLAMIVTVPLLIAAAGHALAAELVMFESAGCPYCARWERDIAPGYEASEDGKLFPLARRDRRAPDVAFIPRIVYSPTFVMLVRGREVGRIVGYSGSELHWTQLAALIEDARAALQRTGG